MDGPLCKLQGTEPYSKQLIYRRKGYFTCSQ